MLTGTKKKQNQDISTVEESLLFYVIHISDILFESQESFVLNISSETVNDYFTDNQQEQSK